MKRFLFLILLVTVSCVNIKAQGVAGADPALAAAWHFHTSTSKAAINGATSATAATIPEIKWYESKTREYVDYRYKYYNYLDSIQGKLLLYANAVGIGLEINTLIMAFKMFSVEVSKNPDNCLAVNLRDEKEQTITDVIGLIGELNRLFIGLGGERAKVKETERYKSLENIRLKIRELSGRVFKLAQAIHVTSFYYLLNKALIDNDAKFRKVDKNNVSSRCIEYWKLNAKAVSK